MKAKLVKESLICENQTSIKELLQDDINNLLSSLGFKTESAGFGHHGFDGLHAAKEVPEGLLDIQIEYVGLPSTPGEYREDIDEGMIRINAMLYPRKKSLGRNKFNLKAGKELFYDTVDFGKGLYRKPTEEILSEVEDIIKDITH